MASFPEAEHKLAGALTDEAAGYARRALAGYEAVLRTDPGEQRAWLHAGILRLRLGDAASAKQALERAVAVAPGDCDAAWWLGHACESLGESSAAHTAFKAALEREPVGWRSWHLIGRRHRELGNLEVAASAFRRALSLAPDQAEVLLELGDLRWEQADHAGGLEFLQRAVRACPSDPRLRLRLARALAASDDAMAAFELREAKHLTPLDPEIDRELLAIEGQRRLARRKRRHARRLAA